MRTHGFRSNVLLCLLAAASLLYALGLPWYAPAPPAGTGEELGGSLIALFAGSTRWVTETTGATAWQAFGVIDVVLAVVALVGGLAALGACSPDLQAVAAGLLRPAVVSAAGITAYHVLNTPGANAALELRQGAFLALGAAGLLAVSGLAVADAPSRRRRPTPRYEPVPAGRG